MTLTQHDAVGYVLLYTTLGLLVSTAMVRLSLDRPMPRRTRIAAAVWTVILWPSMIYFFVRTVIRGWHG